MDGACMDGWMNGEHSDVWPGGGSEGSCSSIDVDIPLSSHQRVSINTTYIIVHRFISMQEEAKTLRDPHRLPLAAKVYEQEGGSVGYRGCQKYQYSRTERWASFSDQRGLQAEEGSLARCLRCLYQKVISQRRTIDSPPGGATAIRATEPNNRAI
ncbi:hypothetical protein TESG_07703 [Trichophyton tonsurans CBS 112818]|uniref:Uncharacterized protein n=1 Tax=Trichophyton tonsurans (strain CBS 112818) TaxID=647933 RepID=F2S9Z4_TRIT1|nr:hypothetical protein TESG_07703 [Trichophyton tonsurans CBS 112818]